jgi:hypothetical protein
VASPSALLTGYIVMDTQPHTLGLTPRQVTRVITLPSASVTVGVEGERGMGINRTFTQSSHVHLSHILNTHTHTHSDLLPPRLPRSTSGCPRPLFFRSNPGIGLHDPCRSYLLCCTSGQRECGVSVSHSKHGECDVSGRALSVPCRHEATALSPGCHGYGSLTILLHHFARS